MDGILSTLAVVLGLAVIAWICGPSDQRRESGREEMDESRKTDEYVRAEDR
jgi:hypothetical protein